ncbi:MAG: hypothetical protein RL341_2476 [Pseudomonadota bacterium]
MRISDQKCLEIRMNKTLGSYASSNPSVFAQQIE